MTDARRKQVVDVLRKVASLLHTRKAKKPRMVKTAGYAVDLRAVSKLVSVR